MRFVTNLVSLVAFGTILLGYTGRSCTGETKAKASAAGTAAATRVIYTKDRAPATPKLDELPLQKSVSQYGITWTFDKPARVGQFINGDFYVVGPVTVKMIDPKPLWNDEVKDVVERGAIKEKSRYRGSYARHGSTLNLPAVAPRAKQGKGPGAGFDSRIPSGRYDPEQFTHLPIQMKPGDSLVSTISYKNEEVASFDNVDNADVIKTAAVLTCLAEPQPPDAFRPSFCETSTSKIYLARNLRRDLLTKLPPPVPAHVPKLEVMVRAFQRPWLDTVDFGFASPKENFPLNDYGQLRASSTGSGTLMLLLNIPEEEKEPLLVNLVQVGIDVWGHVRGGQSWPAWGGHRSGRKWPLLFAGIMLGDEEMQSPQKHYPKVRFGEDDQTGLCPYTYKGKTYERCWTGARAFFVGHSLEEAGGGKWEDGWGPVELFHPSEWPKGKLSPTRLPASEGYRRANTSAAWVETALAVRIMHAEPVWNHDAFFAYVDRWMTEDDARLNEEIKKAGGPDQNKERPRRFGRQGFVWSDFTTEMWAKYRNNLPAGVSSMKTPPAEETWK